MPNNATNDNDITIAFEGDDTDVQKTVTDVQKSVTKLRASLKSASASIANSILGKPIAALKKFRAAFPNNVLFPMVKVGATIRSIFDGIQGAFGKLANFIKKVLLTGLLLLGASIAAVFKGVRDDITTLLKTNLAGTKLANDVEDIKNKFTELRFSVAAAFLPLIEAAIPYIRATLDWLTRLFNAVAIITASWLGQKQILQVIPGSAAKLAKETEKTKKAAQGALAAFDQINVLAKQTTEPTTTDAPKVETTLVPVTPEAVDAAKDALAELGDKAKTVLAEMGEKVKKSFLDFIYWDNWVDFVKGKWQEFKDFIFLDDWIAIITDRFNVIKEEWDKIVMAFKEGGFSGAIKEAVRFLLDTLLKMFIGFVAMFDEEFAVKLAAILVGIGERLREIVEKVKTFVQDVRTRLGSAFSEGFESIKADGLLGVFRRIANGIIDLMNGVIEAVYTGVNSVNTALGSIQGTIPDWVPGFGGQSISLGFFPGTLTPPKIPRLASGAVIPPNAEFAAVLGDNKKENEILAPESTIRRIIQEELGNAGGGTIENTIMLDGDVLFKGMKRVERRRGPSLLAGGAV